MSINLLDLIIILPIIAMALKGLKNGFVHEVFTLLGTLTAIFLAFTYMNAVGIVIIHYTGTSGAWIPLIGFIFIYIFAIIIVKVIIKALNAFLSFAILSTINLIVGGLFSMFKGVLIFSVILLFMSAFNIPDEETKNGSLLYPYVFPTAPATYNVVAKIYPGVTSFADQAGKFIDNHNPFTDFHTPDDN
jgi:membrane protein required for colicin V production